MNMMFTVYYRIFGDFPAINTDIHRVHMVLANPNHAANLALCWGSVVLGQR
jgi:hypothetical protein